MKLEPLIAREDELQRIVNALGSHAPSFVAVYGRRRVGKTFLVRHALALHGGLVLQVTGQKDAPLREQLEHFWDKFQDSFHAATHDAAPRSWSQAFQWLRKQIPLVDGPVTLFFDEVPWLAGRNHRFLQALTHFWNDWAEMQEGLNVIICGSAASWMVKKVLRDRGGLHNRITLRIRLQPFRLHQVNAYLQSRGHCFSVYDTLRVAMVFGGVPFYLRQCEAGLSVDQNIQVICFETDAPLADEFEELFRALFDHPETYSALVRTIAGQRRGLTRKGLVARLSSRQSGRTSSGGSLTEMLEALSACGFIERIPAFGGARKDERFRLWDEFADFHLRWIEPMPRSLSGPDAWLQGAGRPQHAAWAGFAFEGLCLKHVPEIKRALGFAAVATNATGGWIAKGDGVQQAGSQIDLLIDRADGMVTLCECKFAADEYILNAGEARRMRRARAVFAAETGTKKSLQWALVTPHGVVDTPSSRELLSQVVSADALLANAASR